MLKNPVEKNLILEKDQLTEVFYSGCKTSKKTGIEFEKIPIYTKNSLAVQYEDIVRLMLQYNNGDWNGIFDGKSIIGMNGNNGSITLEPGAQFELSLNPVEKISEIHQRGFIPIVCGGTSFYIDALIDGLAEIPVIPDDFRSEISMQLHTMGRQAFFEQLQKLDPELGRILHPNDTQRILRASEVVQFTGIPLSQWWKKRTSSDFVFHHICIIPQRAVLRERCRLRLERMLDRGVLAEVKEFISCYPQYNGPLKKVIGFNEALEVLKGEISIDEFLEKTLTRTMQYAKRQSTWCRNKWGFKASSPSKI